MLFVVGVGLAVDGPGVDGGPYGANLYGFVHRAFLEYFAATAFTNQFEKNRTLTFEELRDEVYGKHWQHQSWHEVLRLISGIIAPRFAGDLIQFLATGAQPIASTDPNLDSPPPWNLALAIKCLGELKHPNEVAGAAEHLLRQTCAAFELDMSAPPRWFQFFKEQVVPQAASIGPSWPRRELLADILQRQGNCVYAYSDCRGIARVLPRPPRDARADP